MKDDILRVLTFVKVVLDYLYNFVFFLISRN
uniref:Uncharacterized protein n=1 Tax=Geladintestivirus 5 TaxID=3233137 RepID=A0AAU8MHG2_9CAUD